MVAAVDFATFEYALAAVVGHRGLPAGEYVGWVQLWIWVPFVALIAVYLFLLFPGGRLYRPGWRRVGWLAGGVRSYRGHWPCPDSPERWPACQ